MGEQRWKKEERESKMEKEKAIGRVPIQLHENGSASNFENEKLSQKKMTVSFYSPVSLMLPSLAARKISFESRCFAQLCLKHSISGEGQSRNRVGEEKRPLAGQQTKPAWWREAGSTHTTKHLINLQSSWHIQLFISSKAHPLQDALYHLLQRTPPGCPGPSDPSSSPSKVRRTPRVHGSGKGNGWCWKYIRRLIRNWSPQWDSHQARLTWLQSCFMNLNNCSSTAGRPVSLWCSDSQSLLLLLLLLYFPLLSLPLLI